MRFAYLCLAVLVGANSIAAPVPKAPVKPSGILVLDDCDPNYKGQAEYKDNLTFLDSEAKQTFRISGFNGCEAIGSTHTIATDSKRNCFWVLELVPRHSVEMGWRPGWISVMLLVNQEGWP